MTRRTQTHITDTLAIREIISKLPRNWLVRGLEERDYGIDLSIELYDGEYPTGCFSLIQVKGTEKSFNNADSISLSNFPTKTLQYAKLFPEAFFIFYTSVADKVTYFTWAQEYIDLRLKIDKPCWEEQDTNTIYFPKNNILGGPFGNNKIQTIMRRLSVQQEGLKFLGDYERLKYIWEQGAFQSCKCLDLCLERIDKLKSYSGFYSAIHVPVGKSELHALTVAFKDLIHEPILLNGDNSVTEYDDSRINGINDMIGEFEVVKQMFLDFQTGVSTSEKSDPSY